MEMPAQFWVEINTEAPECGQPACGDRTRMAADAGRLGCLPVSNRALLDRLLSSHRDQLRARCDMIAGGRAARH